MSRGKVVVKEGLERVYPKCNYVKHAWFLQRGLEKIFEEVEEDDDGCLISDSKVNSQGYPRIGFSVPGEYYCWSDGSKVIWENDVGKAVTKLVNFRTTAHCYVYWCHRGNFRNPDNPMDISHLCSNKLCLNINHLWLEDHVYNLSRVGCRKRDGPCSHVPKCTGK